MWLLVIFIIVWAISPGPVAVLTLHESRKNGLKSGVVIASGATITSALMILMAIAFHANGFSNILESDNPLMMMIERVGAICIISMGMVAGYKSIWAKGDKTTKQEIQTTPKLALIQGMLVMATYIPQALVYYNVIIPQTVEPSTIITTIILLGLLKVILIFGWHTGIAFMATRSQNGVSNQRFGKVLEVATACLIMGLGFNILL